MDLSGKLPKTFSAKVQSSRNHRCGCFCKVRWGRPERAQQVQDPGSGLLTAPLVGHRPAEQLLHMARHVHRVIQVEVSICIQHGVSPERRQPREIHWFQGSNFLLRCPFNSIKLNPINQKKNTAKAVRASFLDGSISNCSPSQIPAKIHLAMLV